MPAENVYKIPNSMDFVTAASFPVAYGTSHIGLKYKLKLERKKDEKNMHRM